MSMRINPFPFVADRRGAGAVEFALIAPVIATVLLGVVEIGHIAFQRTDMHSALRSGSQYVLNGGRDLEAAESIVKRAWTTKPGDAEVSATRFCLCGDIEHTCNSPCADDTVPNAYIRLEASATLGGVLFDYGQSAHDAVRIR